MKFAISLGNDLILGQTFYDCMKYMWNNLSNYIFNFTPQTADKFKNFCTQSLNVN